MNSSEERKPTRMSVASKAALIGAGGVVLAATLPPIVSALMAYWLPPTLTKTLPPEQPKAASEQAAKVTQEQSSRVIAEHSPTVIPERPQPQTATPAAEHVNSEGASSSYIGENLICWGRIPTLSNGGARHTRAFAFTFAEPFKTPPTVTYGINVVGSGYSFAVYNAQVTETGYTGRLVEVNSRESDVPVSMNYTAIGTPRNGPK